MEKDFPGFAGKRKKDKKYGSHLRNLPFWEAVVVKSGYGRKSRRGNQAEAACFVVVEFGFCSHAKSFLKDNFCSYHFPLLLDKLKQNTHIFI